MTKHEGVEVEEEIIVGYTDGGKRVIVLKGVPGKTDPYALIENASLIFQHIARCFDLPYQVVCGAAIECMIEQEEIPLEVKFHDIGKRH